MSTSELGDIFAGTASTPSSLLTLRSMMAATTESRSWICALFFLSASNPYNRVESILMQYGMQVDRDTVKQELCIEI
jgi:hypothetical protein